MKQYWHSAPSADLLVLGGGPWYIGYRPKWRGRQRMPARILRRGTTGTLEGLYLLPVTGLFDPQGHPFSWGNEGAGALLVAAVLLQAEYGSRSSVPREIYQEFSSEVVALIPHRHCWEMSARDLRRAVRSIVRRRPPPVGPMVGVRPFTEDR